MSKKIKLYKKRRICRFAGCGHLLSVYNSETYCYVHQRLAIERQTSAALLVK